MLLHKCIVAIFVLCFAHASLCKPTDDYLTEGRGIGSTLWGWISYPFSWWSSGEEQGPVQDHLVGPSTYGPYEDIEVGRHNVTVWCNDQTCTTMRCDRFGCTNATCNVYDTNMSGECREYGTGGKPDEPVPPKPEPVPPKPEPEPAPHKPEPDTSATPDKPTAPTQAPEVPTVPTTTPKLENNENIEEQPLELEAVLSATVTEVSNEKIVTENKRDKVSSPKNKI